MVYAMLMEATDSPDPSRFKESELYQRCVAAGVIPATEADLDKIAPNGDKEEAPEPRKEPERETLALQFKVEGMWCPACSWVIQTALERMGGVEAAVCDFATDRLRCRYDPVRTDPEAVKRTIQGLGYRPVTAEQEKQSAGRGEFVRLIVSALLSVNVMMLSWALYSGFFTSLSEQDIRYISWPIIVMATGVMVYGGGKLFRKAWWGMRAGAPGMEALVCLGAGSAYLFSLNNFLAGSWHLYFDTASMLITLVLLGKQLESRAKAGVRQDLEGFLSLQPNKVRMCNDHFPRGRFVALEQLTPGDRFRVKTGEMVPADGRVISGIGQVDESAVTGESRPKAVVAGRNLTSGSLLVEGDITVVAQRVGNDALLWQMIGVIQSALAQRTPIESRTDRWLTMFVPVMVGLAAATVLAGHFLGMAWEPAFVRGLTVLVIACPCALGIAIPLARIAGMSRAGRNGILVRDFEAFERSSTINCAVMDKTGTLTHGNWSLEQVTPHGEISADEVLSLAAGLEKGVAHVVARAVLDHASRRGITAAEIDHVHIAENGVKGMFQGRCMKVGTRDFALPHGALDVEAPQGENPMSRVFLSMDDRLCATLDFGDQVRESTPLLIRWLKDRGFQLHLVSGDAVSATRSLAERLDIENAGGSMLPRDKAEYVTRLQAGRYHVVMVGDGINDAPALASAELSVAVHRDTALAQQAAGVTLMRGDPAQLIDFLNLAKAVNRKVMQNLWCAWIYNFISIPVAMSGLLNPLIAATAMLLSSMTVIGNTLLLVRKK